MRITLDRFTFERWGLTFQARIEQDDQHAAPWEEHDGHGVVTNWIPYSECYEAPYDERGQYWILSEDRSAGMRFYNVIASFEKAKAEQWGLGVEDMAALIELM